MTLKELEKRVTALEEEVNRLKKQVAMCVNDRIPSWERAVEKYKGDEDILAVLRDAMKLREEERRAARRKWNKSKTDRKK
jgi:hypothetical protein